MLSREWLHNEPGWLVLSGDVAGAAVLGAGVGVPRVAGWDPSYTRIWTIIYEVLGQY